MFRKKKKFSTCQFVECAIELDTFHLFTDMPLTAAISKVCTHIKFPHQEVTAGLAVGVLHDSYGHGQPLLPIEIEFIFDKAGEKVGWGEVWSDARDGKRGFYRARILVFDPGARFFRVLERAAEHAAMSGNQFLHIVFQRERKKPYDARTDQHERKEERERLATLMRRIDAGDGEADMPMLAFDSLSIEDTILMKSPAWSSAWFDDVLAPDRVIYHSKETAKWRSQPWQQ